MAKLFLSYSRSDAAKAQRFTRWLEHEGHEVWRDEDDIGAGASFSSEIEKALNDSDAVLVLWSAESVRSAWVRDEAGFGRDKDKLIPFSLDATQPPLGFRQFQSVSLAGWKRRSEPPNPDRIRAALARVAELPPVPAGAAPNRGRRNIFSGRPLLVVSAVAVIAAAALGFLLWQRWSGEGEISIAVVASPQSPDRAMAADYASVAAADLAAFLPRHFDRATVVASGEADAAKAAYQLEISTDPHGAGANASLTLADKDGQSTLWSENWSVPDTSAADLKAQVSEAASKVALCLTDARGGSSRLSQPSLSLYLTGCTDLGKTKLSNAEFVGIFEKITKLAPDFGPGWDYLALSRSWIAESLEQSSPARAVAEQSARQAIAVARKLNPNSAMPYDAEYHLISDDPFKALQVLEQGAAIDPADGRIQAHLSSEYQSVGRMSDAVRAAQNGVELEPGAPYTRSQYILALSYAGEFTKANADLVAARAKWPNDSAIDFADFSLQYRYGEPRRALELLARLGDLTDADMAVVRKVLAARTEPTSAKIDEAIASLRERWSKNPADRNQILLALGNFGRVDQAYQLLSDPSFQPYIERDALFRPDFAGVRADPRFMQVAARVGLVRYWRQTGNWPDFCSSEKLPYDCKTQSAKFDN